MTNSSLLAIVIRPNQYWWSGRHLTVRDISMVPQSDLDWLTWPADELLQISGVVAGWFFGKDAISFTIVQMGFATLVLAAFVALIVFWQTLVEYCRSLWKT